MRRFVNNRMRPTGPDILLMELRPEAGFADNAIVNEYIILSYFAKNPFGFLHNATIGTIKSHLKLYPGFANNIENGLGIVIAQAHGLFNVNMLACLSSSSNGLDPELGR